MDGRLQVLDGPLSVQGTLGGWSSGVQMRLGQNDLPPGVSGGPVIDPVRGEVIGVLKSRSDRGSGGTSTGIEQLRALSVPRDGIRSEHGDLYQAVFHAHDRYHRDRQRHPDSDHSPGPMCRASSRRGRGARSAPTSGSSCWAGSRTCRPRPAPAVCSTSWSRCPTAGRDSPAGSARLARRPRRPFEGARQDGALELVLDYAMQVMAATVPSSRRARVRRSRPCGSGCGRAPRGSACGTAAAWRRAHRTPPSAASFRARPLPRPAAGTTRRTSCPGPRAARRTGPTRPRTTTRRAEDSRRRTPSAVCPARALCSNSSSGAGNRTAATGGSRWPGPTARSYASTRRSGCRWTRCRAPWRTRSRRPSASATSPVGPPCSRWRCPVRCSDLPWTHGS